MVSPLGSGDPRAPCLPFHQVKQQGNVHRRIPDRDIAIGIHNRDGVSVDNRHPCFERIRASSGLAIDQDLLSDESKWDESIHDAFGPPGKMRYHGLPESFGRCALHATSLAFHPTVTTLATASKGANIPTLRGATPSTEIRPSSRGNDRTSKYNWEWNAIKSGFVPSKGHRRRSLAIGHLGA